MGQRELLSNKGHTPHVLVMSVTPIPRTLAIILYGDLDISVIDEAACGRQEIKNCVVDISYRPKGICIYPEAGGNGPSGLCDLSHGRAKRDDRGGKCGGLHENAEKAFLNQFLLNIFTKKMKAKEKNKIMERFAAGEIDVLVSTTVIEVGVNVPNATVMMIENAERFGLAQLHQLRGRGPWESPVLLYYG